MKMNDRRTHLAYKVEHAIDLDSDLPPAATIHRGDRADSDSSIESLVTAQRDVIWAGRDEAIRDAPTGNGYHKAESPAWCRSFGTRRYIPERESKVRRGWTDRPGAWRDAVYGNRRRVKGRRAGDCSEYAASAGNAVSLMHVRLVVQDAVGCLGWSAGASDT